MPAAEQTWAALGLAAAERTTLQSERRGIATWVVHHQDAVYRVKVACAMSDGADPDVASLDRETAALTTLDGYGEMFEPLRIDIALRTRWIDGSPARVASSDLVQCARVVADLHAQGWVHGDLQGGHFLNTGRKVTLLDFGLAHPVHAPVAGYRGGLVHFNAPELCAQVLSEGHGVATFQTDVYAFGASVYFAAFGRFPVTSSDGADYEEILRTIAYGDVDASLLATMDAGAVVAACLAPLTERPQDMGSVVAMLTR